MWLAGNSRSRGKQRRNELARVSGKRGYESPESEGAEDRTPESERRVGQNPRSREKSGARSTGQRKERPEPPGSKAGIRSLRAGVQARLQVGATRGGARKDLRRQCCAVHGISVSSPRGPPHSPSSDHGLPSLYRHAVAARVSLAMAL